MDVPIGRTMPYSLEAEQAVIGSMILNTEALTKSVDRLKKGDFYLEVHQLIFDALVRLFMLNKPVDVVTLSEELKDDLETIGGVAYLGHLVSMVSTTENLKSYIDIISNKSVLRKLINAAGEITEISFDESNDISYVLDSAEQKIFDILQNRDSKQFYHIKEVVPENIKAIEKARETGGGITGIRTGYKRLDELIGGLQKTNLIILAAQTAVGKTAFALNVARNAAYYSKEPVAIFSLEMSKEDLVNRLLWSEAKVEGQKVRAGDLNADDMKKIAHAVGNLIKLPIHISDSGSTTVADIRTKCRKLKLEHGLGFVVIDYLQLIEAGKQTSGENRQVIVAQISRQLKSMAMDLEVPVLALAQLNRESEKHDRPMLSDVRESGAIAQDANIVLFLNRKTGDDLPPEEQNKAECIVAKNRQGAQGTVPLIWRGEYTTFMEPDNVH
ncbi:MAG: replicative DNA helicase [Clostridia bacterium]|nr:replicative DNA helicase [Clostridia bacterium]